jgi:hypothetical protein
MGGHPDVHYPSFLGSWTGRKLTAQGIRATYTNPLGKNIYNCSWKIIASHVLVLRVYFNAAGSIN